MTRGDKREHWREQTSEAMFMVGMFCFTGVLIAIAGYGLPPYAHGLLWGAATLFSCQMAASVRVVYCICKYLRVGRKKP